jgi:glyoxylase-like metal-dependent hydrolase (beta-lactamase superfamily II)
MKRVFCSYCGGHCVKKHPEILSGGQTAMKEIRPGIWFVEGENRGRYPFAHSLFIDGEESLLIDTGVGPALESLVPKTRQVVLSHFHRDHVARNHLFTGASFAIHQADAPGVENAEEFYQFSGLSQFNIEAYWKMVSQIKFRPTKIDRYLEDGDLIDTGRHTLQVLHLPGHTPGHCGYLFAEYGFVFATDIDLTAFGPWYGNPVSDLEQFRNSIRKLRALKPELLATGHSMPITKNIDSKLAAYGEVLDQRDQKILRAITEKPLTMAELTAKKFIYRRHNGQEVLRYFEEQMVRKHLESLVKRKMAAVTDAGLYSALN